jgi:hypothetical protein
MEQFQKDQLREAVKDAAYFIQDRLIGWILLTLVVASLSAAEMAVFMARDIETRFVCTEKGK